MKRFLSLSFHLSLLCVLAAPHTSWSAEKKFKRVLVMGGLGIAPGVGLGMIAGLNKMGWKTDLIIATCGSAMPATIYGLENDDKRSLDFAKSQAFKDGVSETKLNLSSLLKIKKNFDRAKNFSVVPQIFSNGILYMPEVMGKYMPEKNHEKSDDTKIIIVSTRSHYGPESVGLPKPAGKNFTQVFFTDADTAEAMKSYKSPIAQLFPESQIEENVSVMTDVSPEEAIRNSVADPFLLNPGKIGNDYYFTGAVDLFPLELAQSLGEEVISNYPVASFTAYEDLAIESAFGFKQNDSVKHDVSNDLVKWIDLVGVDNVSFNPRPTHLIFMRNEIPYTLEGFQQGIQDQYDLGYERAMEAVKAQVSGPSKAHLRNPLEKFYGIN
jgi:hypothetical protein